jgi:hypothetical protein
MNNKDFQKLLEIRKLLKEAYDHVFENDSDVGHKSQEGNISIEFGNYWEDKKCQMKIASITIYSYVFGSVRTHCYYTLDEALEVVQGWHKQEMETDYEEQRRLEKEYNKRHPQGYLINPDIKLDKDYWGGPRIQ